MSEYIVEMVESKGKLFVAWQERLSDAIREPIVRCKDCTYYDGEPDLESSMPKCWRDPEHRGAAIWTRPEGFCAWGKRRGDAE